METTERRLSVWANAGQKLGGGAWLRSNQSSVLVADLCKEVAIHKGGTRMGSSGLVSPAAAPRGMRATQGTQADRNAYCFSPRINPLSKRRGRDRVPVVLGTLTC